MVAMSPAKTNKQNPRVLGGFFWLLLKDIGTQLVKFRHTRIFIRPKIRDFVSLSDLEL